MRRRRHHDEGDLSDIPYNNTYNDNNISNIEPAPTLSTLQLPPIQLHSWIPPAYILPFLYLGSSQSLHDESLTKLGITHILSFCNTPHYHTTTKTHKHILLRDASSQALRPYAEDVCAFVDAAQERNGACLVHCSAGVSRSPAMVLAYFVLRRRCALKDAYAHIKALRPQVAPNHGFWVQLLEMEREVLGCISLDIEELEAKKAD
jgi:atypical dual specificity phosphatase